MQLLSQTLAFLRTITFYIGLSIHVTVMFILALLIGPFLSFKYRFILIIVGFTKFAVWWAKVICGLNYQVIGKENIPESGGYVIMSNHQSTWETLFLQTLFIPQTQVLKKELLWVPFFGWGLALLNPIFIDRSNKKKAMKKVLTEGKKRLDKGRFILIFPEGTRIKPGQTKTFGKGGALLASTSSHDIIPIAHNSGEFWPTKQWIKKPGTITMVIGEPIKVKGKKADAINTEAERWINETALSILTKNHQTELKNKSFANDSQSPNTVDMSALNSSVNKDTRSSTFQEYQ